MTEGLFVVVGRVSFKSIFAASESNLFRFALIVPARLMQLFTWEEAEILTCGFNY